MDIETVKAMLKKADPKDNPSTHERRTALSMAQREMDKNGWSYSSLGFNQQDAERIANQFSVGFFSGAQKTETREPLVIFQRRVRKHQTPTSAVRPEPLRSSPSEPYVSYADQCEKRDQDNFDAWYYGFVAYQANQIAKEAEENQHLKKIVTITFILLGIFAVIVLVFVNWKG